MLPETPEYAAMHGDIIFYMSMMSRLAFAVRFYLFNELMGMWDRIFSYGQKQRKSRSGVPENGNLSPFGLIIILVLKVKWG